MLDNYKDPYWNVGICNNIPKPRPPESDLYDGFGLWMGFIGANRRLVEIVKIYYENCKTDQNKPIRQIKYEDFLNMVGEIELTSSLAPLHPLMKEIVKDYEILELASKTKDDVGFQQQARLLRQHIMILKDGVVRLLGIK